MTLLILFGLFILLSALSVPIAVAVGAGVVASIMQDGIINMTYVTRMLIVNVDSFTMTAIPFFVLAGQLMAKCGISDGLFEVSNAFLGRKKGGIMMVAVLACMIFGAITGSAFATVASIGMIAIPEMRRQGVPLGAAAALMATAGGLGQMIPPSMGLVVLGGMNDISISGLFAAEIIPGIFVGLCFIAYCAYYGKKHNIVCKDAKVLTFREKMLTVWNCKWSLLMPIIILGGIYTGIVTPTEAAVVSVVYGFIYGLIRNYARKKRGDKPLFSGRDLVDMLYGTVITTVGIMFIMGISSGFGKIMTLKGFPAMVSNLAANLASNKYTAILLMSAVLFVLGTFLDGTAINVIVSPILFPIAAQFGIDPFHFGVIFVFVSTLGLITPPMGANMFVAAQIADTTFEETVRYIWPWILVFAVSLLVVMFVPVLSTWLPGLAA